MRRTTPPLSQTIDNIRHTLVVISRLFSVTTLCRRLNWQPASFRRHLIYFHVASGALAALHAAPCVCTEKVRRRTVPFRAVLRRIRCESTLYIKYLVVSVVDTGSTATPQMTTTEQLTTYGSLHCLDMRTSLRKN